MTTNGHDPLDDDLSAAARSLHREWDSPRLWPSITSRIRRRRATRWYALAAAAVVLLSVSSALWIGWPAIRQATSPGDTAAQQDRLLSDEAFAAIERSEAQYVRALDDLTRLVAPKLEMPDSPLLISLRERLTTIDAAIAESRMQIDQNPFNAQLRRQLLFILQEKRQTLEQIQDYDQNTL